MYEHFVTDTLQHHQPPEPSVNNVVAHTLNNNININHTTFTTTTSTHTTFTTTTTYPTFTTTTSTHTTFTTTTITHTTFTTTTSTHTTFTTTSTTTHPTFTATTTTTYPTFTATRAWGHEPKIRSQPQPEKGRVIIPDPLQTAMRHDVISTWHYYAKMTSIQHAIYLQLWRPVVNDNGRRRKSTSLRGGVDPDRDRLAD